MKECGWWHQLGDDVLYANHPISFHPDVLSALLAAYENGVFARAEPSAPKSRQARLDAHDFSRIVEGSPLVAAQVLK
jgi:hypothetical protein